MVKKFQIIREWLGNLFNNQEHSQKKFLVVDESSFRQQNSNNNRSGRFGNISQTRPQKCPVCRTEEARKPGNIFRTSEREWGCKACGHKWG